jgi:hypothetical protein
MATILQTYDDLRFTPEQLYFTDMEYASIAKEFFGIEGPKDAYTNRDRAFLQAALFVAVDKSEKAKLLFDIWSSFVSAAPSGSITKLMKKLVQSGAKYTFSAYIDDSPKYSAIGRAGVQYGPFITQWRLRVGVGDVSALDNFLKYGN